MAAVFRLDKQSRFIAGSRVIKADEYASLLSSDEIIEEAHRKADLIAEQARKEAEEEKERGYRQGLEQGKQAADDLLEKMTGKCFEFLSSLDHVAVELVIEALHKIMGEMDDTDLVVRVIRRILSEMSVRRMLTIRVPVGMEEEVRRELADVAASYPGMEIFSVVGDSHLSGTDCILDYDLGTVEAGMETQLKHIKKAFDARLKKGRN